MNSTISPSSTPIGSDATTGNSRHYVTDADTLARISTFKRARSIVTIVITFGTFDLLHVGHLRLLERAASMGDRLVVGVSTDALSMTKKGRLPAYSENQRIALVGALRCVDATFLERSLELKTDYIREHKADLLVMGDDWKGRFDWVGDLCRVVYLERTPSISTTEVIEKIRL